MGGCVPSASLSIGSTTCCVFRGARGVHTHTLVKANFVCNRCHEVAHKISDLENKPCPVSVEPSEFTPHAEGSEQQKEKFMLEARREFTYAEEVKELRRLKLLKKLQEERETLAKLLEQKKQSVRSSSAGNVHVCECMQCHFLCPCTCTQQLI